MSSMKITRFCRIDLSKTFSINISNRCTGDSSSRSFHHLMASNLFVRCKLLAMRYMIAAYHFWGMNLGCWCSQVDGGKTVPSLATFWPFALAGWTFPFAAHSTRNRSLRLWVLRRVRCRPIAWHRWAHPQANILRLDIGRLSWRMLSSGNSSRWCAP